MSHNTAKIDNTEPSSLSEVSLFQSALGLSNYPKQRTIAANSIAVPAGYNIPVGRNASINVQILANSVTARLGTTRAVIASQYAADWFDQVLLPAGTWFLRACVTQDPNNASNGSFGWVVETTGSRIGPVCSMRDAQRSAFCWGYVTFTSATYVSLRAITATVWKNSAAGYGRFSMVITKVL